MYWDVEIKLKRDITIEQELFHNVKYSWIICIIDTNDATFISFHFSQWIDSHGHKFSSFFSNLNKKDSHLELKGWVIF